MKKILAFAAAAGMMMLSSNANAQAVVVNNVSFTPGSITGNLNSSMNNNDTAIGRFEFKGNYVSGGAAFDIFTYCVDLTKFVSTGNVNYTSYAIMPISAMSTITTAKANALNALLTNTNPLLAAATGQNAINISAATQMAVWEIMFETQASWSVSNTSSAFSISTPGSSSSSNTTALTSAKSLANSYLNNISNNTWTANNAYQLKLLYSTSQQSQVFLTPSVPEPATWAMMMIGFGAMGGALRYRRRSVTATVAA